MSLNNFDSLNLCFRLFQNIKNLLIFFFQKKVLDIKIKNNHMNQNSHPFTLSTQQLLGWSETIALPSKKTPLYGIPRWYVPQISVDLSDRQVLRLLLVDLVDCSEIPFVEWHTQTSTPERDSRAGRTTLIRLEGNLYGLGHILKKTSEPLTCLGYSYSKSAPRWTHFFPFVKGPKRWEKRW